MNEKLIYFPIRNNSHFLDENLMRFHDFVIISVHQKSKRVE